MASGEDVLHHAASDVGEAEVASGVAVGELLVVEAQEVEDGGVPVVDVDLAFDGFVAVLVSGTVAEAAFDATTGHPGGVAFVVVIATVAALGVRRAPKLTGPDDEGVLEEIALFEIGEQARDGFVDLAAGVDHAFAQVAVVIPAAVGELDETHAGLDHAAGEQALLSEVVGGSIADAVERASGVGFLRRVEQGGHGGLHAVGELEGLNHAFDLGLVLIAAELVAVELLDERELSALGVVIEQRVLDVGKGLAAATAASLPPATASADLGALVNRGEEGAAEVDRRIATTEHDEAGEVGILRAESVECPCAHGRTHKLKAAGVGLHGGLTVIGLVAVHAAQQAEIIGVLAQVRKQAGDPKTAFTMLIELPGRAQELGSVPTWLAVVGRELGLVVKGVDVRGRTAHGEEDDVLGTRGEVRLLLGEWIVGRCGTGLFGRHGGEGDGAEATGDAAQGVAAAIQWGMRSAEWGMGRIHERHFLGWLPREVRIEETAMAVSSSASWRRGFA